jgi:hypothetical protein
MLAPVLEGHTEFALRRVPQEKWLFAAGSRYVIRCEKATFSVGKTTTNGGD